MYAQRILHTCLALALMNCIALTAFAENGENDTTTGGYKIGIVNMKEIFDGYQKQKDLYVELEKVRDKLQEDITKMSAQIEADKKKYNDTKDTMTSDQRRDLEDQIQKSYSEYQAEFKRRQDEIARGENRIRDDVFEDVNKAVNEIGLKQNYHLILESGVASKSGVLYFSSTLNMTQRVVDYLNEQYKKEQS